MENPKFFSDEALADFRQRVGACGVAAQQVSDALATAYLPAIRRVFEAMRPLIEFANSPEGQALIRAEERRRALMASTGSCHCLCIKRHPDQSLCLGEVPSDDLEVIRFRGDLLGAMDVPMCPPCASAR